MGDLPFMVGVRIGMGGMPEPPEDRIAWARRYCVLRDQPLQPSVNPILAAQTLLESRQFQLLDEYHRRTATSEIRSQALAMAHGLLPPFPARSTMSRRPTANGPNSSQRPSIARFTGTTNKNGLWPTEQRSVAYGVFHSVHSRGFPRSVGGDPTTVMTDLGDQAGLAQLHREFLDDILLNRHRGVVTSTPHFARGVADVLRVRFGYPEHRFQDTPRIELIAMPHFLLCDRQ